MAPLADMTFWLLTTFVEVFVAYLFLIQGLFRRFLFLNIYLLLSPVIDVTRYALFSHFGFAFNGVIYFYSASADLLTILLFLSICELGVHLVGTGINRRRIRMWSSGALVIAAFLSFSVAASWGSEATTRAFYELSQYIFYACCLAILLLWAWKLRNDPEDRIAARFVNVLGVYFSVSLLIYGAGQLNLHVSNLNRLYFEVQSMADAWLPLGCGFSIVSHQQPGSAAH